MKKINLPIIMLIFLIISLAFLLTIQIVDTANILQKEHLAKQFCMQDLYHNKLLDLFFCKGKPFYCVINKDKQLVNTCYYVEAINWQK